MHKKAFVVIDIQNDITKHYRDIIDRLNAAIDWAVEQEMDVVYIKHNNLSPGTRTFKPDTKGAELVPELKIVSNKVFVKTKANALTSEEFSSYIRENGMDEFYFISPIVDMEKLIGDMMQWANVTEEELRVKGVIRTDFGEDLSWEYLCYVREHPIKWGVQTSILYGSNDNLTSREAVRTFSEQHNAVLTVMEGGEHWFRTDEQMQFLDDWIRKMRSQFEYGDFCNSFGREKRLQRG